MREKEIEHKIITELTSLLTAEIPDHLMSLHHVSKLLTAHRQKTNCDAAQLKNEAKEMSTKLGPAFLNQFYYWDDLTSKCCESVKKYKRKNKKRI